MTSIEERCQAIMDTLVVVHRSGHAFVTGSFDGSEYQASTAIGDQSCLRNRAFKLDVTKRMVALAMILSGA